MLTSQKADSSEIVSIPMADSAVEDLLTKEWLLTNNRGGYSSSTIVGCNTRRYHGLLIGSPNPPANRIMGLANCLETIIFKEKVFNLSTFEFSDKFAPKGFRYIKQFRRDTGVHFDYQSDKFELTKSVYLLRNIDTVVLIYDFTNTEEPADFVLRPFIGLRNFHELQKSYASLCSKQLDSGLLIRHDVRESYELFLSCSSMNHVGNSVTSDNVMQGGKSSNVVSFEKDEQWWFNFVYRKDKQRGQDFTEDLWTPGFFKHRLDSPARIVFWANLGDSNRRFLIDNWQSEIENYGFLQDLHRLQKLIIDKGLLIKGKRKQLSINNNQSSIKAALCLAADQFIVTRNPGPATHDAEPPDTNHEPRTTILAGFPWFADWGRDAFIALPGLLLSTGRFDEAKSVLTTFAAAADEGMIPNRFDDHSDTAYFNSVDASLWFINAAFQYLKTVGDSETFTQQLLPTIRWIIDRYHNGTRFDIYADTDGLVTAGNDETQLTWMDAKYDGVAFTPRCGKAVEINALWYNALSHLAQFYAGHNIEDAERYKSMANKVAAAFCELFWNETTGYLNDCILPDGSPDASLRPNQIFAVSLPFSPLSARQAKSVVDTVQKNLLTPYGLRTLNVQDSRYKGKYTGPQRQRDEAYHQGTVWPYLIGPFVAGYLKVNNFSRKSKRRAAEFIEPLMQHLTEDDCLGQLCEIFDGDPPHQPRGCFAQAWSVAGLIRAYHLIYS